MRWVAALLAAALVVAALGCGGGGAEPGAPQGATLVLDFQPNAVHSGIYAAQADGDLRTRASTSTSRSPRAPRTRQAARRPVAPTSPSWTSATSGSPDERGLDLVAIAAIVQRPARLGDRARPRRDPHAGRPRRQDDRGHRSALRRRRPRHGAALRRCRPLGRPPGDDRLQRRRRPRRRQGRCRHRLLERGGRASCARWRFRPASSGSTSSARRGIRSCSWWRRPARPLRSAARSMLAALRLGYGVLGRDPQRRSGRPARPGERGSNAGDQSAQLGR